MIMMMIYSNSQSAFFVISVIAAILSATQAFPATNLLASDGNGKVHKRSEYYHSSEQQKPLLLATLNRRRPNPLPLPTPHQRFEKDIVTDQLLIELVPGLSGVQLLHSYDIGQFQGYALQLLSETTTNNNNNNNNQDALSAAMKEALDDLRFNPDIQNIEYNQRCYATAILSVPADSVVTSGVQTKASWNLDRISKRHLPLNGNYTFADQAGQGVDVFVLDTGVYAEHSEFEGRARFGASFNRQPGTGDDNGHGTHVAGIIAGRVFGVAKKASITSVRVLNADGSGRWDVVLAGLDWTLKNAKNSTKSVVVNGGRSSILNRAVDNLVRAGFPVIVAAGNNAVDACNESPASASFATTVGATSPYDELTAFSNFGKCVELLAPGEYIRAAWKTGAQDSMYLSGTSMAAPHVVGVYALLISSTSTATANISTPVNNGKSKFTPLQLRNIIVLGATSSLINHVPKSTVNLLLYNNPPLINV